MSAGTAGLVRVTMPQLGESVTEGQISRWLKHPGDRVEKYEALVEVITDKVNAEVPSPIAGVLAEIHVEEGETVAVGTLICSIGGEGAAAAPAAPAAPEPATETPGPGSAETPPAAPEAPAAASAQLADAAPAPSTAAPPAAAPEVLTPTAPETSANGDRAGRASPAVRRLATEHNLDISAIRGTGIEGRVTKRDVEEYLAAGRPGAAAPAAPARSAPAAAVAPPAAPAPAAAMPARAAEDELIPLNPMRKAIAEHMVRSRQTSPHAWCAVEVDMSSVVALRAANKSAFKDREGIDLTFVPFVIKASVESLKKHPEVNATFTADGILRKRAINISVAIGLPDGLIVPVIRDADMLSVSGIAHKLNDLATRARAGRLKLEDVEGGTFCVNNPGTFGTVISAPIINQPQAAIMTMEAIVKRPVVLPGDNIGIRSMMFCAMSFDHRVMDGLQAASFLGDVKRALEAMDEGMPIY